MYSYFPIFIEGNQFSYLPHSFCVHHLCVHMCVCVGGGTISWVMFKHIVKLLTYLINVKICKNTCDNYVAMYKGFISCYTILMNNEDVVSCVSKKPKQHRRVNNCHYWSAWFRTVCLFLRQKTSPTDWFTFVQKNMGGMVNGVVNTSWLKLLWRLFGLSDVKTVPVKLLCQAHMLREGEFVCLSGCF